jgi:sugar phosphate isomerase/epimerase
VNSFGILQGRVIPPRSGRLQVFPDKWEEEFSLIAGLGFSHVELLDDKENRLRELLKHDREAFLNAAGASGLNIASVCMDNLAGVSLLRDTGSFLSSMDEITSLLSGLRGLTFVLPFFGENAISSGEEFSGALDLISDYDAKLAERGHSLSLEADLPAEAIAGQLRGRGFSNIKVCYDIGNRAGAGADTASEIRLLGSLINHVHVKDKENGKNVRLRKGQPSISGAFSALKETGYRGIFALETNPFPDAGKEAALNLATAKAYSGGVG